MKRGKKPKPTRLKLVTGTFNPSREKKSANEPEATGRPVKPKQISKAASAIWDTYVGLLPWLRAADGITFMVWCTLTAEFEKSPKDMKAARITQMRLFGELIGVSPSSRTRLSEAFGSGGGGRSAVESEYFND